DADADGAAVVAGRLHHLAHPIGRADVPRVDPKTGGPRLGGLDPAPVVEVDVRDQRDLRRLRDGPKRRRGVLVRAGDADDVRAGLLQAADLVDGRRSVGRDRIGHRLDGDGRIPPHLDRAYANLARWTARDGAPGADVGV